MFLFFWEFIFVRLIDEDIVVGWGIGIGLTNGEGEYGGMGRWD